MVLGERVSHCSSNDDYCSALFVMQERAIKEAKEIIKSGKRTEDDDKLHVSDSDHTSTDTSDPHSVAQ